MAGVMNRLASMQYPQGAAAGTNYYGGNSVGAGVSANVNVGAGGSVDLSTSARTMGIVVLIALAVAFIGYHGLKG